MNNHSFYPLKGSVRKNESWYTNVKSVSSTFISTRVSISVAVPQCLRTSLVIKSFLQISECKWSIPTNPSYFRTTYQSFLFQDYLPILLISGLPTNSSYFRTTYQSFLFQDYPLILLNSRLPTNPSYFRTTH